MFQWEVKWVILGPGVKGVEEGGEKGTISQNNRRARCPKQMNNASPGNCAGSVCMPLYMTVYVCVVCERIPTKGGKKRGWGAGVTEKRPMKWLLSGGLGRRGCNRLNQRLGAHPMANSRPIKSGSASLSQSLLCCAGWTGLLAATVAGTGCAWCLAGWWSRSEASEDANRCDWWQYNRVSISSPQCLGPPGVQRDIGCLCGPC